MFAGVMGEIDMHADGRQDGHLELPHSVDRSPYYRIRIPFTRLRGGPGPSVLLIGGTHGDEYEGPVAITRLVQALAPDALRGAITALPALNMPAVEGHARCSPLDGGNLNRLFPGASEAGPTAQLAAYVENVLIPQHDIVFDLHSGGTSMAHLPCALTLRRPGEDLSARTRQLLQAMGLEYCFVVDTDPGSPTSMGAALRAGKIALSGEFGGGAALTPGTVAGALGAIEGVLMALEMISDRLISHAPEPDLETRFLRFNHPDLFVFAPIPGWYEPLAGLGDEVRAGQPACRIWDLQNPTRAADTLYFGGDGIVLARRQHTHIRAGDCLYALGGGSG